MTRTKWAASGAVGALTAAILVFVGVQTHGSSATAVHNAPPVAVVPATAVAEPSRAASAGAADPAAAAKAAADKAAAVAAEQQAANAVAGKRAELAARSTVDAYFEAINSGDYRTAFDLGGHHFNSSYDSFRTGFDNTSRDEWEITRVSDNRVYVTLTAHNLDCTTQVWHGYYVVTGGELTKARLTGGQHQDCI